MSTSPSPADAAARSMAEDMQKLQDDQRGPDHAYIVIEGPYGTAYIQSENPDKVEIGTINIGNGKGVSIRTQGSAEVGELNVGLDTIIANEAREALGTESGATAIFLIAATLIVFAAITIICWRAMARR